MVAVTTWEGSDSFTPGRVAPTGDVLTRTRSGPAFASARPSAATYRRRRAVAASLAVLVVALVVWAMAVQPGGGPLPAPGPSRPAAVRGAPTDASPYVVQPGDTFWTIARRLDPKGDVRPLVDRLVSAHGGSALYVGERIALPPP